MRVVDWSTSGPVNRLRLTLVEDLRPLGEQVVVGPLSNANLALLLHMARRARLPWTVIIGSDATRAISPIAAPTVWPPRCSGSIPAR